MPVSIETLGRAVRFALSGFAFIHDACYTFTTETARSGFAGFVFSCFFAISLDAAQFVVGTAGVGLAPGINITADVAGTHLGSFFTCRAAFLG